MIRKKFWTGCFSLLDWSTSFSSWLVTDKEVGFGNPSFSSDMNLGSFCCGLTGSSGVLPRGSDPGAHTHKRVKNLNILMTEGTLGSR